MNQHDKKIWIDRLHRDLMTAPCAFVFRYQGVAVKEMQDFRRSVKAVGGHCRVMKNRLALRSVLGTDHESLVDLLKYATCLIWGEDPAALAKVLGKFSSQSDVISIEGGVLEGKFIQKSGIKTLANLPSLEILHGQLLRVMLEPSRGLVSVLQAPMSGLVTVLGQYLKSKE